MRISVTEYIKEQFMIQQVEENVFNIEDEIKQTENNSKEMIDEYLYNHFVLLDFGITTIYYMHKMCEKKHFLYACITAKIMSQLLSMRILLYQGQMDSVKIINRSFHEMIEIFFACLIDEQFFNEYGELNKLYDNNKFWREKVNRKLLDSRIHKIFDELGYPKEAKKKYFKRRDDSNAFLSQSVHATLNSAFSAYMMPMLNGKYSTNVFGKITTAYPLAVFLLLEDIVLVNSIFFQLVINDKAVRFSSEDLQYERYNYYAKMYDKTFETYCEELYDVAYKYSGMLKKIYKEVVDEEKKLEMK